MRRVILYLIVLTNCSIASFGQPSPSDTLFTINETAFSSSMFLELYQNQNFKTKDNRPLSIEEALDLYIVFQLKLAEAKKLQLDTISQVKREIQIYQDRIFNSYLYPKIVSEEKIVEAFNRIQFFLRARHIFVSTKKGYTPRDTLAAYSKIYSIYNKLQKGERFEKIAKSQSDDLSARFNKGEIGFFTAFDLDYPFESAAYNLNINEISKPVRTEFGYHIVQVMEKIPNPGKVKIKQIFFRFSEDRDYNRKIKQKADSIYQLLKEGADFEVLRKSNSDDRKSVHPNEISWIGLFETHPEIERVAFQLKHINDFSEPIKTDQGYHIIQLVGKKDYSSIEKCREEIVAAIEQDNRAHLSKAQLIQKIKHEYNFSENRKLLSNFYSILDYAYAELWETMFTIGGKEYTQEDFANYLSQQPSKDIYENFKEYINRVYDSFSNNSILAFYKNQLIKTNPELEKLLLEYKDGVLVFSITKQKIWTPSVNNKEEQLIFFQNRTDKYGTDFEKVKNKVISDYQNFLEKNWTAQLKKENRIVISESTLQKIAKEQND